MPEGDKSKPGRGVRRIPPQSVLYDRIIPIVLIGMGVLMVVIVAIALGILVGLIRL